ncbi:MAG TPA: prepilin peptidase [bacterium]|jgi:leader peptidase (prepilin peptidase)/N-methyltransferase
MIADPLVVPLALFVFGTILGSFFNVVIYRLPRGQSLVAPGSRCPHCGRPIRWWDNIPLLSFANLRGRCRHCGRPIGWRYPAVEFATGALLVLLWFHFAPQGRPLALANAAILSLLLVPIFFIDLEHRLVPNAITYPGIVIGLILAGAAGRLVDALLTGAGAGAFFFAVAVVSRGGMGGGDVKLAAMLGVFLGWPDAAVAILLAFIGGAAVGVGLIAARLRTRKDAIPFGPALAAGAIVALFAAGPLVRWYLGLQ